MITKRDNPFNQFRNSEARAFFQDELIHRGIWTTCLNCEHWDQAPRICQQYQSTPPDHVIVVGCPAWQETIPF